ncbi:MAG: glycosyltransferase family 1 protein [Deltaproteobacteria bacterium]|nr:MAG: glycosyltransferase family 1 protein [Deltaproteobacteria bacterium]
MKPNDIAIIHYSGPPIVGGVESTIFFHAKYLVDYGFSVTLIAGRGEKFHQKVEFVRIPEVDSRNPDILRVAESLNNQKIPREFYELRDSLREKLLPKIRDKSAVIVHNVATLPQNLPLTSALHLLAQETSTPFILWCHDIAWLDPVYLPRLHEGYPWDLLRTRWEGVRYVTISKERAAQLSKITGIPEDEISIIPPGVEPLRFFRLHSLTEEILTSLNLEKADPLILYPTRIIKRKNIEFAINVVSSLRDVTPDPHLVITGPPGPHNPENLSYLQTLLELKETMGVGERVHFLYERIEGGETTGVPEEILSDLFRVADLVLFPSLREGFGIPLLEGGLSLVPIFTTHIPSVSAVGSDLVHLISPDESPHMVALKIASFLENDRRHRLRKKVMMEFSWERIIKEKLIPLLKEVFSHERAWTKGE